MRSVADWQLDKLQKRPSWRKPVSLNNPRDWQQGVFWLGITALAEVNGDAYYRDIILKLGTRQNWRLGDRPYHADDHLIGQTWLWAARHGAGSNAAMATREALDAILANPSSVKLDYVENRRAVPDCMMRWCWSDALFMAPATLFGLSALTGDARYADFADREFRATAGLLYDRDERLFYRDSRFISRRDRNGHKLFWSRGNGWVLGGLANSLTEMTPKDPHFAFYTKLFREMAERIAGTSTIRRLLESLPAWQRGSPRNQRYGVVRLRDSMGHKRRLAGSRSIRARSDPGLGRVDASRSKQWQVGLGATTGRSSGSHQQGAQLRLRRRGISTCGFGSLHVRIPPTTVAGRSVLPGSRGLVKRTGKGRIAMFCDGCPGKAFGLGPTGCMPRIGPLKGRPTGAGL